MSNSTKTDNHPLEAVLALSALVEHFYKTTRNSIGRQSYNNAYRVIAAKLDDKWSASTICNVRQEYNGYTPGPALAAAIVTLHGAVFHVKHTKPKRPKRNIGHVIFETERELRDFQQLSMGERIERVQR